MVYYWHRGKYQKIFSQRQQPSSENGKSRVKVKINRIIRKMGQIRNGQSRETGNIRYTRHRMKTIQRNWQNWVQKTQDEDNPEKLATLGTQDTG